MKKRISLLSLCLGLFIAACTDSSGFEDLQNFSEKEVMPRAAGDGIYDVLSYGYDITSDYLGEASVRQPVLDVEAFIRDNKGRFDNPLYELLIRSKSVHTFRKISAEKCFVR